jgi:D-3-phosphoglycerate dehydrogenase
MKPGAVLINTSRGGLIDEAALAQALIDGHLAGAGLDVLEGESVDMKNPQPHSGIDVARVPNLLVTPHVAGQTAEAFLAAGTDALAAIRHALAGDRPATAINDVAAPTYS